MKRGFLLLLIAVLPGTALKAQVLPDDFIDPPREFSVMPFWFWNDSLRDEEIIRQIADMESHGVYGFLIHPRIGLPANVGWLSPEMIHAMDIAISEVAKRNMLVILYDKGMYPSGSSSGQVVERNPAHAASGLAKIDLAPGEEPVLPEDVKLITIIERPSKERVAIIERSSGGVIRGLHYLNEGEQRLLEESPPAGDILNTDSRHICDIAILCDATYLPDKSAGVLYRNQRDFNYLEIRHLREDARITRKGVRIAGMTYKTIIIDTISHIPEKVMNRLWKIAKTGHLIVNSDSKAASYYNGAKICKTDQDLLYAISLTSSPDISLNPASPSIRYRHIEKNGREYFMFFNEEGENVVTSIDYGYENKKKQVNGEAIWIDPYPLKTNFSIPGETISLRPYEMKILMISDEK